MGPPKGVLARDGESLSALIEQRITHGYFFLSPFSSLLSSLHSTTSYHCSKVTQSDGLE